MVSGNPCGNTLSGAVLLALFHARGIAALVVPLSARWNIVNVCRTTA